MALSVAQPATQSLTGVGYAGASAPLPVQGSSGLGAGQGNANVQQWSTASPQNAAAVTPSTAYPNTTVVNAPPPSYYFANGAYAGSGSAGAAAAQQAADTAAYYQSQIDNLNGQAGQLDNIQNIGLQNYENSYNQNANRQDAAKAQANDQYNQGVTQNQVQYDRNRTGIVQNTQANINALQRLLGMNGAGNSSAAYEEVPYAAGIQGTQQLNDAQSVYGQNGVTLDTNWKNYLNNWQNSRDDLNNQRFQNENALKASIAQQRATLLNNIADAATNRDYANGASYQTAVNNQAGYRNQVNSLLGQIAQLGNQYQNNVLRVTDPTYSNPTVNQWLLNQHMGPLMNNGNTTGNPGTSDVSPTLAPLLDNQKRDQFGNVISPATGA